MQQVKHAGNTNNTDGTVTRVVSSDSSLTWLTPVENAVFRITQDAQLPDIVFEFRTQVVGTYKWSWTIEWKAKASGLEGTAHEKAMLYKRSRRRVHLSAVLHRGQLVFPRKCWAEL